LLHRNIREENEDKSLNKKEYETILETKESYLSKDVYINIIKRTEFGNR
jgi:hypothetical protein